VQRRLEMRVSFEASSGDDGLAFYGMGFNKAGRDTLAY